MDQFFNLLSIVYKRNLKLDTCRSIIKLLNMPENQKICGKHVKMWDPKHANFLKEM